MRARSAQDGAGFFDVNRQSIQFLGDISTLREQRDFLSFAELRLLSRGAGGMGSRKPCVSQWGRSGLAHPELPWRMDTLT